MLLSRVVFGCVVAFAAGIFFASFVGFSFLLSFVLLGGGIVAGSVFWQRWGVVAAGFCMLLFGLGMVHYQNAATLPEQEQPTQVSFEARVVLFPEKDEQRMRVVVETKDVPGRVLLFTSPFVEVAQGNVVFVSGKMQTPRAFEDFDYPLFLKKDGVLWVMFQPSIEVRREGRTFLSELKARLQETADTFLPVPESSLLSAMLLGNKAGLPEELKEDLNITGTRHITAISGMHVAVLSGMLFLFLLSIGMSRKKSSLFILAFLIFFVVFTGAEASAVRAGIMGGAFLAAGVLGMQNTPLRTLVFAGGAMLVFNPLLLAHDVGFQLSFLAVLGIVLFLPVLQYISRSVPNPFGARDIFFMSIAAQVFTLPLVLSHFGILSFVSLATNLLIVPLLPLVLFSGAVFLLVGALFPFLAAIVAFPVGLLLSYVSFVVQGFSQLPFAAGYVEGFSVWVLSPPLLLASFFAWRFGQQQKFRFSQQIMFPWI